LVFNNEAPIGLSLIWKLTCLVLVYYFGFLVKTEATEVYTTKGREKKEINTVGQPPLPLLAAPAPAPCRSHLT
jgi:hypothetical protein